MRIKRFINIDNAKDEIETIIQDLNSKDIKVPNSHQILDLKNYLKPINIDFVLDCTSYKQLLAHLKTLKNKAEELAIRIGNDVYYKESAYNALERVCIARYLKNLLSLTYEKLLVDVFKDEYKAKLCHFRDANYDFIINNHKYDNKVIMLSNKNKKYDCEKLKNQDNNEIQILLKNLLENSFNKNNDTSKCFFVFISESNNYDNVLKTVKDTDFTIKFLHSVLNNHLNQYKHSVYANNRVNDVILFMFVLD